VKTTLFEHLVQKWTIGDVLHGCVPSNFRKSFQVRTWAKNFALSDRHSLIRCLLAVLSSTSPYSSVLFLILHSSLFIRCSHKFMSGSCLNVHVQRCEVSGRYLLAVQ
jgi:hypothetical protein